VEIPVSTVHAMTDRETLALNLRRYLEHAPLRDLALVLDQLGDELRARNLDGVRELRQVSAQLAVLGAARAARIALAAEHAHAPIFGADCSPTRK